MADDPIAARYAQALFEASTAAGILDPTLEQLTAIGQLLHDHAELRQFLLNPDVEADDKAGVLDRLLKGAWSPLTRAFIRMVVAAHRAEFLPEMVQAFQAAVDRERGILRVTVRSAHPLPETVLARLRTRLERRERKHIQLATDVDPALLGGLQIVLDHRVIDGSVRRQLVELHQQLTAIKVT